MGCGWVSRLLGCLRVSHLDSALSKFVTFNPFILEPYPELEEVIVESCELVHSEDGRMELSLVHRQVKKILEEVCLTFNLELSISKSFFIRGHRFTDSIKFIGVLTPAPRVQDYN